MTDPIQLLALESTLKTHGLKAPSDHAPIRSEHRQAALCYICTDERVLLLRRKQPPFVGRWTAPGGKVRAGETPDQAVQREIFEETGLTIEAPRLRMVVLESGPVPLLNWLLYVYQTHAFEGTQRTSNEGPLQWVLQSEVDSVGMPDIDLVVSQHVLTGRPPQWMEVAFDADEETSHLSVTPLRTL